MMSRIFKVAALVVLVVALTPSAALADTVTVTGTGTAGNGVPLAASVTFTTLAGGQLMVTLTNTASSDVQAPQNILTGIFFTISGVTLTPVSATLGSGSTVIFPAANCVATPAQCSGTDMGGEWGYASSLSGAPGGAAQGISSSGLGFFASGNFNGPNLWAPTNGAVDGLQGGILSTGDNTSTGNAPVTGGQALVQDTVVFILGGLPTNFTLSGNVTNVSFQYGTGLCEPNIGPNGSNPNPPACTPVPEPGTLALFGTGLLSLAGVIRRRIAG